MKIAFLSAECAPFAKTGGLGDVVGALPRALRDLGHDARVWLPLYSSINREKFGLKFRGSSCVHMGAGEENWVGIWETEWDGVPISLIEFERFFGRGGIYGDPNEFVDNAYRFALLPRAAFQDCRDSSWIPDIAHLHDWSSALGAAFLVDEPDFTKTASVLTIHNIGYQGIFGTAALNYIGLNAEISQAFVDEDGINLLKAGVRFADELTTVSPKHARELLETEGAMGLVDEMNARRDDLTGILNGVDYGLWNPETDALLPANYSANDLGGKMVCKAVLQERFELDFDPRAPVLGIVSRFAAQKGFDLLRETLPRVLDSMRVQLVVLGTGDAQTEAFFRDLQRRFPGRVGAHIGFSEELSHLIEAGSDFFLMPSLYEPCGLNQSYSMRYGTLPIVRATGGLDDTVENYDESSGAGTGFKFYDANASALYFCVGWAVSTWYDRFSHIEQMRRAAMAQQFSWRDSAREYVAVYERALAKRGVVPAG